MAYLIDFKSIRATPEERRFTDETRATIQGISIRNPEYPSNLNYTCYGAYGQVVPYLGYDPEGYTQPDWEEWFTYPFDQKLGYFGKKQYVHCPDGKQRLANHNLVHVRNSITNNGYGVGVTPIDRNSGSTLSLLTPHMFTLRNTPLAPNDFTPYLGDIYGQDLFEHETKVKVRQKLMSLEADAFYQALDRTVIADVGGTLVEIVQLGSLFTTFGRSIASLARFATTDSINSVHGLVKLLEHMAGFWLQFQYGLKPIWSGILDYNERMNRKLSSNSGLSTTVQRSGKDSYEWTRIASIRGTIGHSRTVGVGGSVPNKPLCAFGYANEGGWTSQKVHVLDEEVLDYSSGTIGDGNLSHEYTSTLETRVTGEWMIGFGPSFILDQFNLMPSLGHVWEIIPFSFIIDWFWKVGDFLSRVKADDSYAVYGVNLGWELKATTTYSTGASMTSRLYMRSAEFNPSGAMVVGSGLFARDYQLTYFPQDIKPGTMVTKFDARAGNALALLTILTTAITRSRHIAKTTADKQLAARMNRLLSQIGAL